MARNRKEMKGIGRLLVFSQNPFQSFLEWGCFGKETKENEKEAATGFVYWTGQDTEPDRGLSSHVYLYLFILIFQNGRYYYDVLKIRRLEYFMHPFNIKMRNNSVDWLNWKLKPSLNKVTFLKLMRVVFGISQSGTPIIDARDLLRHCVRSSQGRTKLQVHLGNTATFYVQPSHVVINSSVICTVCYCTHLYYI